jgi:hypothetical protein
MERQPPVMTDDTPLVNAILRQGIAAVQEVMGDNGLRVVLREAGLERYIGALPPNDLKPGARAREYALLNEAVERFYGRGGKGMLRRIGRASFRWAVREQAALLGVAGVALKVMPQRTRMKFILGSLAKALKDTNPEHVYLTVIEKDGRLILSDYCCSMCHTRHAEQPICNIWIGTLQEALKWATDKEFEVTETLCRAKGDPCCQFVVGDEVG